MLHAQIDSQFSYICQIQPTAPSTSCVIAKCVPETNILIKFGICDIYAKYLKHTYIGAVCT